MGKAIAQGTLVLRAMQVPRDISGNSYNLLKKEWEFFVSLADAAAKIKDLGAILLTTTEGIHEVWAIFCVSCQHDIILLLALAQLHEGLLSAKWLNSDRKMFSLFDKV